MRDNRENRKGNQQKWCWMNVPSKMWYNRYDNDVEMGIRTQQWRRYGAAGWQHQICRTTDTAVSGDV